jgi:hypothetical protein
MREGQHSVRWRTDNRRRLSSIDLAHLLQVATIEGHCENIQGDEK